MLLSLRARPALGRVLNFVLDLLYPQQCGGCGAVGRGVWCDRCRSITVRLASGERIRRLALASGQEIVVVSAAPYVEPLQRGIREFKYEGVPQLAQPFADLMIEAWTDIGWPADVLVPVPLHARRLRERGFNQSELLARWVSQSSGIPIDLRALRRTRNTQHQVGLGAAERKQNLLGAFAADPASCAGAGIVLIDDVLTTGTTLCECAEVLLASGATCVAALTLARAVANAS